MAVTIQVLGSLLVLLGFAATQRGYITTRSLSYLVLNFTGSAVLAVEAVLTRQWGFTLLEGVWAIISAAGLAGVLLSGRTASASPDHRPGAPRRQRRRTRHGKVARQAQKT
jgi:mannose/fructose/N-acetylgalactosamine-specific phosphotransferase system component IIC